VRRRKDGCGRVNVASSSEDEEALGDSCMNIVPGRGARKLVVMVRLGCLRWGFDAGLRGDDRGGSKSVRGERLGVGLVMLVRRFHAGGVTGSPPS
jgi:hypothetical protein